MVECHYKLSDKLMKENEAIKVLELAFGLAPQGLKWTENPKITYVKFDLP
jgi:hypothetical protein